MRHPFIVETYVQEYQRKRMNEAKQSRLAKQGRKELIKRSINKIINLLKNIQMQQTQTTNWLERLSGRLP